MIIVGDLHLKNKGLFWKHSKLFLNWLQNNYNNEIILFLGDIFDTSTPIWEVYTFFKHFLLERNNKTYIIQGNHDISKLKGSSLQAFDLLNNVSVFNKETEIEIEGYKCLILPFQYNCDNYANICWEGDFCFTHTMPKQESFGGEFVDLLNIKAKKIIYGHIHTYKELNNLYIVGTPVITRHLEKNNDLLEINNYILKKVKTNVFFDIQDLEFGEDIPNKDYLYNIKNAPSSRSVFDMYPNINIRDEGITILYKNVDDDELVLDTNTNDLKVLYKNFCEEKEIENFIIKEGITTFTECGI